MPQGPCGPECSRVLWTKTSLIIYNGMWTHEFILTLRQFYGVNYLFPLAIANHRAHTLTPIHHLPVTSDVSFTAIKQKRITFLYFLSFCFLCFHCCPQFLHASHSGLRIPMSVALLGMLQESLPEPADWVTLPSIVSYPYDAMWPGHSFWKLGWRGNQAEIMQRDNRLFVALRIQEIHY